MIVCVGVCSETQQKKQKKMERKREVVQLEVDSLAHQSVKLYVYICTIKSCDLKGNMEGSIPDGFLCF